MQSRILPRARLLMLLSLVFPLALVLPVRGDASFDVVEELYSAKDPARDGHTVVATLYRSANNTGPVPVVAFAHGFGLGADMYPLAKELTARRGMTVLLPHNFGAPVTTNLAMDQAFLVDHAVRQSLHNASSPFYGRVSNRTVLAGHSLGGGSTLLAADSKLASAYPAPTAIATVSLGVGTIPGAMPSVPRIPSDVPALLFTATQDCVDDPKKNSLPVFSALRSSCAYVISIVGGSHCQFAARSIGCTVTERLCGAHPNITSEQQVNATLSILLPYLDAALGSESGRWSRFQVALQESVNSGRAIVLAQRTSCIPQIARGPVSEYPGSDPDAKFVEECQRLVASPATSRGTQLAITQVNAGWQAFLTTKPSLQLSSTGGKANVTIIVHNESTKPFSHSVAIKMKNAEAISSSAASDNATCADLHERSLAMALSELSPEEREAYGIRTKRLRFDADLVWSTGLWVPLARLQIIEAEHDVVVAAPRFYASAAVPGKWGGVFYCRLLPPVAIRDWIKGQVAIAPEAPLVEELSVLI